LCAQGAKRLLAQDHFGGRELLRIGEHDAAGGAMVASVFGVVVGVGHSESVATADTAGEPALDTKRHVLSVGENSHPSPSNGCYDSARH